MKIEGAWIEAAQAAMRATGQPASVCLAQFGQESDWGKHAPGNNPFGIKATPGHPFQVLMTHEEVNGKLVPIQARFAVFASLEAAFMAHANLLATAEVYKDARACLAKNDLVGYVENMAIHYATDPIYDTHILNIMEQLDLYKYDTFPLIPFPKPQTLSHAFTASPVITPSSVPPPVIVPQKAKVTFMSQLTQLIRHIGGGTILNAVEALEGNAKPAIQNVETVAIQHVGTLLSATSTAALSKVLGPAAVIAEPLVTSLLDEFEDWIAARLGITLPAATPQPVQQAQAKAGPGWMQQQVQLPQALDVRRGFLGLRRGDPAMSNVGLMQNRADADDFPADRDETASLVDPAIDGAGRPTPDDTRSMRAQTYRDGPEVTEYRDNADETFDGAPVALRADEAPDFPSIDLTGAEDLIAGLLAIDARAKAQGHSLAAILNAASRSAFGINVI